MDPLVDVAAVRAFLATAGDPAVVLQTALVDRSRDPDDAEIHRLRARLYRHPRVVRRFDQQAADGSWGSDPVAARRILPTLWLAKIFVELGLSTDHCGLARALDFLVHHAVVDDGVSIDGRRDGVLSCYTGILAETLLLAGRPDSAAGPLRWISTYQQIRYAGHDYLGGNRPVWGAYLATRYGGCFAASTCCLLGEVKCGLALVRAADAGRLNVEGRQVLIAIRDLLADRELFRRRGGGVIPLAASPAASAAARERWLFPAFPLTYQTDLLELAQLAADVGVPMQAMAPALGRLAAWRLPDGTWPMLRRCSAPIWYQPERPRAGAGSYWITLRVLRLWKALQTRSSAPAGPETVQARPPRRSPLRQRWRDV